MGGGYTEKNKNIYDESWNFFGDTYYYSNNNTRKIQDKVLKGTAYLKVKSDIKEILIDGETEKKKFNFKFIQSYKQSADKIYFKLKNENNISTYIFKKLTLIYDEKNPKIFGEIIDNNKEKQIYLDLYDKIQKKENKEIYIDNYMYYLKKLEDPIDKISNTICGLNNLGNTCYINSSFQIMIHIRELVKIIITKKSKYEGNIIEYINKVFDELLKQHGKIKAVINPRIFVDNFKNDNEEYNNYLQNDTEMFLEDLIWSINSQLGVERIKRSLPEPKNNKQKLFFKYLEESEDDCCYEINDLFYVYFIHEKKCMNKECNCITYYFDQSTGLKLNFKYTQVKQRIDLITLIKQNFLYPCKIKSSFVCEYCRKCYEFSETTRIAKLPKILIISLQKTDEENKIKIPWVVDYPDPLELEKIDIIDDCLNENGSYEIYAINNHSGNSPQSGHYYSIIKLDELKSWFTFNDSYVDIISTPSPSISNYILFYRKK